ncbi:MAG: proline iminopeptidase-family hydrolase [Acidobacteriia bacterium]|nr:proline iminopeptidase-family hydrolase [Terriglobia bacterium]
MRTNVVRLWVLALATLVATGLGAAETTEKSRGATYPVQEQFVDANGVLIYTVSMGRGAPLVVVHGGPGASHDYFLPYMLPLARTNRLVFIDERGSGRSEKLEAVSGYTVDSMVEDIEAVRVALGLGKINLLGHSFGGVLAQAYAFKYQQNLTHLVLCSTFHSTKALNEVFRRMKSKMSPELRARIDKMEANGLFGHGKDFEKNRYTNEYMIAAWGEGYFPYLYQNRPDPNYDPVASGNTSWDLYREMWGSHGEFLVDGNLASVEYADRLHTIRVPTLITVGDHDESDPSIAREMAARIEGSNLVVLPRSGHMTFVDQPGMFIHAVDGFLNPVAR